MIRAGGALIAQKSNKQPTIKETDLYEPVKAYFSARGYEVKGEVGAADMVAIPLGQALTAEPVIIELKTAFTLTLFHQAISRQSMSDQGLGMITVRMQDKRVDVHCEPAEFKPRKMKKRKEQLLSEFETRHGDPNLGGMSSTTQMTSYRQGALRCAKVLHDEGACKASYVAKMAGFDKARSAMANNHYGWFEKVDRGIYGLTPAGAQALEDNAALVSSMMDG